MCPAPGQIQTLDRRPGRGPLKSCGRAMWALPVEGTGRRWKKGVQALRRGQRGFLRCRIEGQAEFGQRLEAASLASGKLLGALLVGQGGGVGNDLEPFN